MGLNTALMFAEGEWIIKIDDSTEFKPDFFELIDSDIATLTKYYKGEKFIIRPVKLEGWTSDTKWNKYHLLKDMEGRYIGLGRKGIGGVAFTTLDQVVCPLEAMFALNGYDEDRKSVV